MAMLKREAYAATTQGKNSEKFREWLQEFDRVAISENRLDLVMHSTWWDLAKALYHASFGVDEAVSFMAELQKHGHFMDNIIFRPGKSEQPASAPTKKAARVTHPETPDVKGAE